MDHRLAGQGQDIDEFKYFKRWFEAVGKRPAVQRGMAVGKDLSSDTAKLPPEEQARIRKSSTISAPFRRRGEAHA